MSTLHHFYFYDDEEVFIAGTTVEENIKDKQLINARLYGSAEMTEQSVSASEYEITSVIELENPPENFLQIQDWHEAGVLDKLRRRIKNKDNSKIYTFLGSTLVSINLFNTNSQEYENKFNDETKQHYINHSGNKSNLPAHLYVVIERCIYGLKESSQSIYIGGISGSGKSETLKRIIEYIAYRNTNNKKTQKVVLGAMKASNFVLEFIGNAYTPANDNSSRFGRFVEMWFDHDDDYESDHNSSLIAASNSTYMLEKTLVTSPRNGSRNFHIFYGLLYGLQEDRLNALGLIDLKDGDVGSELLPNLPEIFTLSNDDINFYIEKYQNFVKGLRTMGVPTTSIKDIESTIAGIIHLCCLSMVTREGEDTSKIDPSSQNYLVLAVKCLGIDSLYLTRSLTYRSTTLRDGRSTRVPVSPAVALKRRDLLCNEIYDKLFISLLGGINSKLRANMDSNQFKTKRYISCIDIHGFECASHNSLDQFLINLIDESLQLEFNKYMFQKGDATVKLSTIDKSTLYGGYVINAELMNTLRGNGGVVASIEEQCQLRKSTWREFMSQLKALHRRQEDLGREASFQVGSNTFTVTHTMGSVEYDPTDFLSKNVDPNVDDLVEVMSKSSNPLIAQLFKSSQIGKKKTKARTVCAQWNTINEILSNAKSHHIKCIRGNSALEEGVFDTKMVFDQLKRSGVFQALISARVTFSVKISHEEFVSKYFPLIHFRSRIKLQAQLAAEEIDLRIAAQNIVDMIGRFGLVVGKSEIVTSLQELHYLEGILAKAIEVEINLAERFARGFLVRTFYRHLVQSIENASKALETFDGDLSIIEEASRKMKIRYARFDEVFGSSLNTHIVECLNEYISTRRTLSKFSKKVDVLMKNRNTARWFDKLSVLFENVENMHFEFTVKGKMYKVSVEDFPILKEAQNALNRRNTSEEVGEKLQNAIDKVDDVSLKEIIAIVEKGLENDEMDLHYLGQMLTNGKELLNELSASFDGLMQECLNGDKIMNGKFILTVIQSEPKPQPISEAPTIATSSPTMEVLRSLSTGPLETIDEDEDEDETNDNDSDGNHEGNNNEDGHVEEDIRIDRDGLPKTTWQVNANPLLAFISYVRQKNLKGKKYEMLMIALEAMQQMRSAISECDFKILENSLMNFNFDSYLDPLVNHLKAELTLMHVHLIQEKYMKTLDNIYDSDLKSDNNLQLNCEIDEIESLVQTIETKLNSEFIALYEHKNLLIEKYKCGSMSLQLRKAYLDGDFQEIDRVAAELKKTTPLGAVHVDVIRANDWSSFLYVEGKFSNMLVHAHQELGGRGSYDYRKVQLASMQSLAEQVKEIYLTGIEWELFVELCQITAASWLAAVEFEITEATEALSKQVALLEHKKLEFRPVFKNAARILDMFYKDLKHKCAVDAIIQSFLQPVGRFAGEPDQVDILTVDEVPLQAAVESHNGDLFDDLAETQAIKQDQELLFNLRRIIRTSGDVSVVASMISKVYEASDGFAFSNDFCVTEYQTILRESLNAEYRAGMISKMEVSNIFADPEKYLKDDVEFESKLEIDALEEAINTTPAYRHNVVLELTPSSVAMRQRCIALVRLREAVLNTRWEQMYKFNLPATDSIVSFLAAQVEQGLVVKSAIDSILMETEVNMSETVNIEADSNLSAQQVIQFIARFVDEREDPLKIEAAAVRDIIHERRCRALSFFILSYKRTKVNLNLMKLSINSQDVERVRNVVATFDTLRPLSTLARDMVRAVEMVLDLVDKIMKSKQSTDLDILEVVDLDAMLVELQTLPAEINTREVQSILEYLANLRSTRAIESALVDGRPEIDNLGDLSTKNVNFMQLRSQMENLPKEPLKLSAGLRGLIPYVNIIIEFREFIDRSDDILSDVSNMTPLGSKCENCIRKYDRQLEVDGFQGEEVPSEAIDEEIDLMRIQFRRRRYRKMLMLAMQTKGISGSNSTNFTLPYIKSIKTGTLEQSVQLMEEDIGSFDTITHEQASIYLIDLAKQLVRVRRSVAMIMDGYVRNEAPVLIESASTDNEKDNNSDDEVSVAPSLAESVISVASKALRRNSKAASPTERRGTISGKTASPKEEKGAARRSSSITRGRRRGTKKEDSTFTPSKKDNRKAAAFDLMKKILSSSYISQAIDTATNKVAVLRTRPFNFEREWHTASPIVEACAKSELFTFHITRHEISFLHNENLVRKFMGETTAVMHILEYNPDISDSARMDIFQRLHKHWKAYLQGVGSRRHMARDTANQPLRVPQIMLRSVVTLMYLFYAESCNNHGTFDRNWRQGDELRKLDFDSMHMNYGKPAGAAYTLQEIVFFGLNQYLHPAAAAQIRRVQADIEDDITSIELDRAMRSNHKLDLENAITRIEQTGVGGNVNNDVLWLHQSAKILLNIRSAVQESDWEKGFQTALNSLASSNQHFNKVAILLREPLSLHPLTIDEFKQNLASLLDGYWRIMAVQFLANDTGLTGTRGHLDCSTTNLDRLQEILNSELLLAVVNPQTDDVVMLCRHVAFLRYCCKRPIMDNAPQGFSKTYTYLRLKRDVEGGTNIIESELMSAYLSAQELYRFLDTHPHIDDVEEDLRSKLFNEAQLVSKYALFWWSYFELKEAVSIDVIIFANHGLQASAEATYNLERKISVTTELKVKSDDENEALMYSLEYVAKLLVRIANIVVETGNVVSTDEEETMVSLLELAKQYDDAVLKTEQVHHLHSGKVSGRLPFSLQRQKGLLLFMTHEHSIMTTLRNHILEHEMDSAQINIASKQVSELRSFTTAGLFMQASALIHLTARQAAIKGIWRTVRSILPLMQCSLFKIKNKVEIDLWGRIIIEQELERALIQGLILCAPHTSYGWSMTIDFQVSTELLDIHYLARAVSTCKEYLHLNDNTKLTAVLEGTNCLLNAMEALKECSIMHPKNSLYQEAHIRHARENMITAIDDLRSKAESSIIHSSLQRYIIDISYVLQIELELREAQMRFVTTFAGTDEVQQKLPSDIVANPNHSARIEYLEEIIQTLNKCKHIPVHGMIFTLHVVKKVYEYLESRSYEKLSMMFELIHFLIYHDCTETLFCAEISPVTSNSGTNGKLRQSFLDPSYLIDWNDEELYAALEDSIPMITPVTTSPRGSPVTIPKDTIEDTINIQVKAIFGIELTSQFKTIRLRQEAIPELLLLERLQEADKCMSMFTDLLTSMEHLRKNRSELQVIMQIILSNGLSNVSNCSRLLFVCQILASILDAYDEGDEGAVTRNFSELKSASYQDPLSHMAVALIHDTCEESRHRFFLRAIMEAVLVDRIPVQTVTQFQQEQLQQEQLHQQDEIIATSHSYAKHLGILISLAKHRMSDEELNHDDFTHIWKRANALYRLRDLWDRSDWTELVSFSDNDSVFTEDDKLEMDRARSIAWLRLGTSSCYEAYDSGRLRGTDTALDISRVDLNQLSQGIYMFSQVNPRDLDWQSTRHLYCCRYLLAVREAALVGDWRLLLHVSSVIVREDREVMHPLTKPCRTEIKLAYNFAKNKYAYHVLLKGMKWSCAEYRDRAIDMQGMCLAHLRNSLEIVGQLGDRCNELETLLQHADILWQARAAAMQGHWLEAPTGEYNAADHELTSEMAVAEALTGIQAMKNYQKDSAKFLKPDDISSETSPDEEILDVIHNHDFHNNSADSENILNNEIHDDRIRFHSVAALINFFDHIENKDSIHPVVKTELGLFNDEVRQRRQVQALLVAIYSGGPEGMAGKLGLEKVQTRMLEECLSQCERDTFSATFLIRDSLVRDTRLLLKARNARKSERWDDLLEVIAEADVSNRLNRSDQTHTSTSILSPVWEELMLYKSELKLAESIMTFQDELGSISQMNSDKIMLPPQIISSMRLISDTISASSIHPLNEMHHQLIDAQLMNLVLKFEFRDEKDLSKNIDKLLDTVEKAHDSRTSGGTVSFFPMILDSLKQYMLLRHTSRRIDRGKDESNSDVSDESIVNNSDESDKEIDNDDGTDTNLKSKRLQIKNIHNMGMRGTVAMIKIQFIEGYVYDDFGIGVKNKDLLTKSCDELRVLIDHACTLLDDTENVDDTSDAKSSEKKYINAAPVVLKMRNSFLNGDYEELCHLLEHQTNRILLLDIPELDDELLRLQVEVKNVEMIERITQVMQSNPFFEMHSRTSTESRISVSKSYKLPAFLDETDQVLESAMRMKWRSPHLSRLIISSTAIRSMVSSLMSKNWMEVERLTRIFQNDKMMSKECEDVFNIAKMHWRLTQLVHDLNSLLRDTVETYEHASPWKDLSLKNVNAVSTMRQELVNLQSLPLQVRASFIAVVDIFLALGKVMNEGLWLESPTMQGIGFRALQGSVESVLQDNREDMTVLTDTLLAYGGFSEELNTKTESSYLPQNLDWKSGMVRVSRMVERLMDRVSNDLEECRHVSKVLACLRYVPHAIRPYMKNTTTATTTSSSNSSSINGNKDDQSIANSSSEDDGVAIATETAAGGTSDKQSDHVYTERLRTALTELERAHIRIMSSYSLCRTVELTLRFREIFSPDTEDKEIMALLDEAKAHMESQLLIRTEGIGSDELRAYVDSSLLLTLLRGSLINSIRSGTVSYHLDPSKLVGVQTDQIESWIGRGRALVSRLGYQTVVSGDNEVHELKAVLEEAQWIFNVRTAVLRYDKRTLTEQFARFDLGTFSARSHTGSGSNSHVDACIAILPEEVEHIRSIMEYLKVCDDLTSFLAKSTRGIVSVLVLRPRIDSLQQLIDQFDRIFIKFPDMIKPEGCSIREYYLAAVELCKLWKSAYCENWGVRDSGFLTPREVIGDQGNLPEDTLLLCVLDAVQETYEVMYTITEEHPIFNSVFSDRIYKVDEVELDLKSEETKETGGEGEVSMSTSSSESSIVGMLLKHSANGSDENSESVQMALEEKKLLQLKPEYQFDDLMDVRSDLEASSQTVCEILFKHGYHELLPVSILGHFQVIRDLLVNQIITERGFELVRTTTMKVDANGNLQIQRFFGSALYAFTNEVSSIVEDSRVLSPMFGLSKYNHRLLKSLTDLHKCRELLLMNDIPQLVVKMREINFLMGKPNLEYLDQKYLNTFGREFGEIECFCAERLGADAWTKASVVLYEETFLHFNGQTNQHDNGVETPNGLNSFPTFKDEKGYNSNEGEKSDRLKTLPVTKRQSNSAFRSPISHTFMTHSLRLTNIVPFLRNAYDSQFLCSMKSPTLHHRRIVEIAGRLGEIMRKSVATGASHAVTEFHKDATLINDIEWVESIIFSLAGNTAVEEVVARLSTEAKWSASVLSAKSPTSLSPVSSAASKIGNSQQFSSATAASSTLSLSLIDLIFAALSGEVDKGAFRDNLVTK